MPLWVTEPPQDDELNIYIVGVGHNDEIYDSVLSQLYERFNIIENEYFANLILTTLHDQKNDNITIIDTWSSDSLDYILVRFNRSFFDPIIELYSIRFDEMVNFIHEYELDADNYLKNGELYSAYNQYTRALEQMLLTEDEFYTPAILKVIDKIKGILNQINYLRVETFSELIIGKPIIDEHFYFKVSNSETQIYNGFLFRINFNEGWSFRNRSATIPVKNNAMLFIPPVPKKSGSLTINSYLLLDDLIVLLTKWSSHSLLSVQIREFHADLESIIAASKISFDYDIKSDINLFTKIISFKNPLVTEGILRFLVEIEDNSVISPLYKEDESFPEYIREVNRITDDLYPYMILGNEINRDITTFDEDGILIKLSGSFYLVDMNSTNILQTQSLSTEFLGVVGEEDLAYLDFGLKAGEVIYSMKF